MARACCSTCSGRFDESAQTYEKMVDLTSHANGAYTAEEKNSRSIFLERLAGVYQEQGKVDQAIATYQKMVDLGADEPCADLKARWKPTAPPKCSTKPSTPPARPSMWPIKPPRPAPRTRTSRASHGPQAHARRCPG